MKIIIKGNKKYVMRMFKHLRKEHPSTRKKMTKSIVNPIRKKKRYWKPELPADYFVNPKYKI